MSSFKIFQTATATLKKFTTDVYGDETVSNSWTVDIDPTFGYKRVFTIEGEEVTGQETIITADNLGSIWDETHYKWKLTYQGKDYIIKNPVPFKQTNTGNLEHVEVLLT